MDFYLSQIMMWACNFTPRYWAFCDGSILSIVQNTALYSLLGTYYGGDGRNTFGLPNLCGRVPVGMGQGPWLSNYTLGQIGGAENIVLTLGQIPSHAHALNALSGPAGANDPAGNLLAQPPDRFAIYANGTPNAVMASNAIGNAGDGQGHANIQPYAALNFCICVNGIYPSRQ